ncbi:hypothetical protein OM209_22055 [Escherichia albertii]|nr:hypothetical protein [Escherichia albertii]
MDKLRRYVITMPDEHCYYGLALVILSLNSASGTSSAVQLSLSPVNSNQIITDNGK